MDVFLFWTGYDWVEIGLVGSGWWVFACDRHSADLYVAITSRLLRVQLGSSVDVVSLRRADVVYVSSSFFQLCSARLET